MSPSIHRVIVRGQFEAINADQRAALLAEVDDHEIFKAGYTEHGCFTYDATLNWLNLRYEVRLTEDQRDDGPAEIALGKARQQLGEWGLGHKHLRATATDMSAMWDG